MSPAEPPRALILGKATQKGTADFFSRAGESSGDTHPNQPRMFSGLSLSSIGIGTYLGADTDEIDASYSAALARCFEVGINVLDTAVNYRSQRSERVIGATLVQAISAGKLERAQILVASKAGYLPYDNTRAANPQAYFHEHYIATGIVEADELVSGVHCMSPRYLDDQIERSRRNLGLETIDVYYLHNPESHLEGVSRELFQTRLRRAFETLERAAMDGRIQYYGAATWHGFRKPPSEHVHNSLAEFCRIAEDVGGTGHHFRCIQLPYNLAMIEAKMSPTQETRDLHSAALLPLLTLAEELGVYVMASASVLQGQLTERLPDNIRAELGLRTDTQRCLQFVRSTPGIGTALVGMKRVEHVSENAEVLHSPTLSPAAIQKLYDENQ